jgi:hypothetical protein
LLPKLALRLSLTIALAGCDERSEHAALNENRAEIDRAKIESAKSDCDEILETVIPFAEKMLVEHGEFYPFGGTMTADGKVGFTAGWSGDEDPEPSEVLSTLEQGFRAGAKSGKYKAISLVFQCEAVPPGKIKERDAIAASLDHRDGYSAVLVFPYSFAPDGKLVIEESFTSKGGIKILTP